MNKLSSLLRLILITCILSLPVIVFAQGVADIKAGLGNAKGIIDTVNDTIVKSLATLLLSSALLVFFYGIVEYIWGKRQGDSTKVKAGNDFITWGLVALFVMFSVYGIIKLAQSIFFGGKDVTSIEIPSFNFKSGSSRDVQIGSPSSPGQPTGGGPTYSPSQPTGGTTLPGYGSGTGACTPPMVQNPEGGCYTPVPGSGGGASQPTGGASVYINEGADCTSTSECSNGLSCTDFKCTAVFGD